MLLDTYRLKQRRNFQENGMATAVATLDGGAWINLMSEKQVPGVYPDLSRKRLSYVAYQSEEKGKPDSRHPSKELEVIGAFCEHLAYQIQEGGFFCINCFEHLLEKDLPEAEPPTKQSRLKPKK